MDKTIDTLQFYQKLVNSDIHFFTGVPDSLLKDFGNCLFDYHVDNHIIAANEGNAIALAAGSYLATGKIPLVYLQNSGLGNTINPLLSMADKSLYAIPMVILVGWRGQPGIKDAEQHIVQGAVTIPLIEAMNYPYLVLSKNQDEAFNQIDRVVNFLKSKPQPYFIIVQEDSFTKYKLSRKPSLASDIKREGALQIIAQHIPKDSFVVSTTGKTSREWYEVREQLKQDHSKDFLTVGSMGHTSSIALGMALSSNKKIVCIDGDGSMLMHLGAIVVASKSNLKNFYYIVINNFAHESVGGLPTPLEHVNFEMFFKSIGFYKYFTCFNFNDLDSTIKEFFSNNNSVLEIRVLQGSREDLARPKSSSNEITKILRKEFDDSK